MPRAKQVKPEDTNTEDTTREPDDDKTGKQRPLEPDPDIDTNQEHPDPSADFTNLLMTYGVPDNKARTIVKNMLNTGSPDVFFNVPELMAKMTAFPMWIPPTTRKLVMDEWTAVNKITLPDNYEELMTNPRTTPQTVKRAEELKKKITEGAVWTLVNDEKGNFRPQLVTNPGETGATLADIKEAIKLMAKESGSDDMLVVYDDATNKWRPNYKSSLVQKNLSAALAAAKQMNNDTAQGKSVDPWDEWTDQIARQQMMRELMGVSQQGSTTGSALTDTIAAFKELVALQGGNNSLPEWMQDPEKARKVLLGDNNGTNPEIAALNTKIDQLIAEQHKVETEALKTTISNLTTEIQGYKTTVESYKDELAKNQKTTGSGAIDVIRDGFNKLPDKADIKSMFHDVVTNPPPMLRGVPGNSSAKIADIANRSEEALAMKKASDMLFNRG